MLRLRSFGIGTLLLSTLGIFAGCVPAESSEPEKEEEAVDEDGEENVGADEQELVGGTAATNAPGSVGWMVGWCSATLIDPRFYLTAGHCLSGSGPRSDTFRYANGTDNVPSSYGHMLWNPDITHSGYEHDLAVVRLSRSAVSAMPARLATGLPANGTSCTKYGMGCQDRSNPGNWGTFMQQLNFTWPTSYANCPGDSGGAAFCNGEIGGVNSAYSGGSGLDIEAHAYEAIAILNAARSLGAPTVQNAVTGWFANVAAQPGAKVVSGQFDWGNTRIAAIGGSGANGIVLLNNTAANPSSPVSWTASSGSITNSSEVSFGTWAAQARGAVSGDFNGDGRDDIALYGGPGWTTIPVAFSNGNGSFTVTNHFQTGDMAHWWNHPQAKVVTGDVDADGDADVIVSGVPGWPSIPIGLSSRDGKFAPVSNTTNDFPGWSTAPGAVLLAGDFNGDGATDVALSGPAGWTTIPVAYSNFNGTWSVQNHPVSYFPAWVTAPGVRFTVGDYDGDGDDDIGTSGGQGSVTALFALSNRFGFEPANLPAPDFPTWANVATMVSGDFNSDGFDDLAVAGGPGWSSVPVLTAQKGVPWIKSGEFLTGTFASSDSQLNGKYVDDYYYTADVATPMSVALTRSTTSSVDTVLQVIDSTTWTVVAENDDSPNMYRDSRLTFTPVRGRTYVLRATTYYSAVTGDYRIMVASGIVVPGETVSGNLSAEDGKAPYFPRKFADDLILVPTSNSNVAIQLNSPSFDTYLEVRYSKTGFIMTSNDDCSANNYNSCVTASPLDHSPLVLRVTSYNQLTTGNFSVTAN